MGKSRPPGFTTSQAAVIADLEIAMVDYLARTKVLVPSLVANPGRGRPREYSFGDLVALKTIKALLTAKVEVSNLRRSISTLQRKYGKTLTSCPADFLFTDGHSVFLRNGSDVVSDVSKDGQLVFLFMCDLRHIHAATEQAIKPFTRICA
jgi:DNA-binding transcriptional MerR regulator